MILVNWIILIALVAVFGALFFLVYLVLRIARYHQEQEWQWRVEQAAKSREDLGRRVREAEAGRGQRAPGAVTSRPG